jgi:hypothetical protein
MAEQGAFVHGGVQYPLTTSSGFSALRDADPSLYYLLLFAASVLQTYIGARIAAEATAANLSTGPNAVTSAVGYVLPYDPETVLLEQQITHWPLLAIWRASGKYRRRTVCRMETIATLKLAYVLPPLSGAQRERLGPLLNTVPKTLLNRIENKFDPGFMGGINWMAVAGVDELDMTEDGWGRYVLSESGGTNLILPCWLGTITLIERDNPMPVSATGGPFAGVDAQIQLIDAANPAPIDLIDLEVNFPIFTGQLGSGNSMLARIEPGAP